MSGAEDSSEPSTAHRRQYEQQLQRFADRVRDAVADLRFQVVDTSCADTAFIAGLHEVFDETELVALDIIGLTDDCRRELKQFRGSWAGSGTNVMNPYAWRVLSSPALAQHHPTLTVQPTGDALSTTYSDEYSCSFDLLDPLLIEGSFAAALRDGGPHRHTQAGAALEDARKFRQELIGDRFDDLLLLTGRPWSSWFRWHLDGWTHAWLITDLGKPRVYVLCTQATD